MSDTENCRPIQSAKEISYLKEPKILKVRNENCPTASPRPKEPSQQKITVEYERVGSFQVFETICPLEFYDMSSSPSSQKVTRPKSNDDEQETEASKGTEEKSRKMKKRLEGEGGLNQSLEKFDSESDEELGGCGNVEPEPQRILITLDAFFRSENPLTSADTGEGTVFWARGDSSTIPSPVSKEHEDEESNDSDLDPDIGKYIRSQKEKKKRGENLTGETLLYDQERSLIRNLHDNGSISLTSYGVGDEKIFGNTEIFESIMTNEEKAMLRPKSPEVVVIKPEKKKRDVEKGKKIKKPSRPKDQGDWVG